MSTLMERGRDMIASVLPDSWVPETITLYRRSTGDTFGAGDSCSAKRSALNNRDLRVQMGLVPAGTMSFIIDASTISADPRQHDKIVDGSAVVWFIDFAQKIVMDGKLWRCEVTRGK